MLKNIINLIILNLAISCQAQEKENYLENIDKDKVENITDESNNIKRFNVTLTKRDPKDLQDFDDEEDLNSEIFKPDLKPCPTITFKKPSIFEQLKNLIFKNKPKDKLTYKIPGMAGKFNYKIKFIIDELNNLRTQFIRSGSLNRMILYGPPGNGKTTIARKIAEISFCKFVHLSAPTLVTSYLGSGPQTIENTCKQELENTKVFGQPVVIFIDEIDAIAANLNSEFRSEHKATLQTLWLCLDKYKNKPNIFFICATNHLDKLHKTFLDRFGDNCIKIRNPDAETRIEIINYYCSKYKLELPEDLIKEVVKKTDGFSARALEDLINEFYLTATQISDQASIDGNLIFGIIYRMKSKMKTKKDVSKSNLIRSILDKTTLIINCWHIYELAKKIVTSKGNNNNTYPRGINNNK